MKHIQLNRENGLVFDPSSGKRFRVNACGAHILHGLQSGKNVGQLLNEFCETFGFTPYQAERNYLRFSRQCQRAGLKIPTLPSFGKEKKSFSELRKTSAA